ncbi:MAG TPA: Mu transposase C-terminal domain-containing protein [Noviherbaspirillum sp.]|nr:Mu transposase C-terminal domain-containing protein [Noviherbaspirillum sp.]
MNTDESVNTLIPGQVFEPVPGVSDIKFCCPQRVLWVDREADDLVVIAIQKILKKPEIKSLSATLALFAARKLHLIEVKLRPYDLTQEEHILKRSRDARDRDWKIIEPLVSELHIPAIFLPGTRGFLIGKRIAELKLKPMQVYRPLYRYWAYGSSIDALLGRQDLSGPTGQKQQPGTKKRGRRPDRVALNGNEDARLGIATATCRQQIVNGIAEFYKPGVTIKRAWEDTKEKYFSQGKVIFGDRHFPIPPEDHQAPSYFQFWTVYHEENADLSLTKKIISTKTWNLRHRGVMGSSRRGLFGPGARFEIDATIVDVYLVSVFNRAWVIGRPVLYVVVDSFSRMVVGFYLGLDGPSWEGARLALFNAFTSKVDFCRRFGIAIDEHVWPCHHLPYSVEGDNLEMKSRASDALPKELGIKAQNAAVCRGDWKPNVEQQFRLINGHTIHFLPGALNTRMDEVYRRNCRLDASLTIPDLTCILIRKLIKYNWSAYQDGALPKEMLGENLTDATPIAVWKWGMENLTGGGKSIGQQKIWTKLLPAATASIRRDGIYFCGRHYASERTMREEWFARVRTNGHTEHIEIRHVPDWPEYIWIFNAKTREWEPCVLLDKDEQFRLSRLEEVMDRAKLLAKAAQDKDAQTRQAFAVFDAECDGIVDRAKDKAAKAKDGLTKTAKTANIEGNRAFEKTAQIVDRAREAAQSYCNKPAKAKVIELHPEMRGPDPLDDIWKL